jgi:hypothetical protein
MWRARESSPESKLIRVSPLCLMEPDRTILKASKSFPQWPLSSTPSDAGSPSGEPPSRLLTDYQLTWPSAKMLLDLLSMLPFANKMVWCPLSNLKFSPTEPTQPKNAKGSLKKC